MDGPIPGGHRLDGLVWLAYQPNVVNGIDWSVPSLEIHWDCTCTTCSRILTQTVVAQEAMFLIKSWLNVAYPVRVIPRYWPGLRMNKLMVIIFRHRDMPGNHNCVSGPHNRQPSTTGTWQLIGGRTELDIVRVVLIVYVCYRPSIEIVT